MYINSLNPRGHFIIFKISIWFFLKKSKSKSGALHASYVFRYGHLTQCFSSSKLLMDVYSYILSYLI